MYAVRSAYDVGQKEKCDTSQGLHSDWNHSLFSVRYDVVVIQAPHLRFGCHILRWETMKVSELMVYEAMCSLVLLVKKLNLSSDSDVLRLRTWVLENPIRICWGAKRRTRTERSGFAS